VLRDCVVIAVEGTHASGKTTLTHALAAYYREQGIHVATVEEPAGTARSSRKSSSTARASSTWKPRWTCSPPSCPPSCGPPASTR